MSTDQGRPRVLVTGGSIAGPATATGLARAGFRTTLLERAPQVRTAGQNVDVRGVGREVLRRMGLDDRVAAAGTGETGTRFLRPNGSTYATLPVRPGAGRDGPTAEVEILRGELSRLLLEDSAGDVELRYGDHLVQVDQDPTGVDVVTAAGTRERYDLLVVAEGKRSATRDLVFPGQVRYRDRGQYVAYGTIDRADGDDDWWQWLTASDARVVSLRPDNLGTARAALAFMAPDLGLDRMGVDTQLAVLRARFAGVGWETQRILDGFAARPREFYFERAVQVAMPTWSAGRVVLVGDSAWAGPTGMGTTLALLGAHVLTGKLLRAVPRGGKADGPYDPVPAVRAYEQALRAHVDKTQRVPPGVPGSALPKSRWGLGILHGAHRAAATPLLRTLSERALLSTSLNYRLDPP